MSENGDIIHEIGYTTSDNIAKAPPIIDVDDDKCFAKVVITQRNDKQFEKYFVMGTKSGFLCNPFDFSEMNRQKRLMKTMGKNGYVFVPTTQVGFKNYLEFLRSNNSLYFSIAQRELSNKD